MFYANKELCVRPAILDDARGHDPTLTFLNIYLAISGDSASRISIRLICNLSTTSWTFSVVLPGVAVKATMRKNGLTA